MKSEFKKIKGIIQSSGSFIVSAHCDPEGDAIGSTLAVANYLLSIGKEVFIYNRDGVPQNLKFLPNSGLVETSVPRQRTFDAAFILDCSEFERVGEDFPVRAALGKIVNIDHHKTSRGIGDVNLIDPRASSTGELIYTMLKYFGADIRTEIAEPIYTAIITDTGSFRYSNTSPEALIAAAELVGLGVKPWKVAQNVYENIPASKIRLISKVLSTLEIFEEERFASVTLLEKAVIEAQALPEHADGLVNYPRSIEGIEVAVIFKQTGDDSFKVGMRSKGGTDVAEIAAAFGGGGHKNAAGCQLKGSIDEVKRKIYERTALAIRKAKGSIASE